MPCRRTGVTETERKGVSTMAYRPLADEIRPQNLDQVVGQKHITETL